MLPDVVWPDGATDAGARSMACARPPGPCRWSGTTPVGWC